jgi:hypothetical protein
MYLGVVEEKGRRRQAEVESLRSRPRQTESKRGIERGWGPAR